jgi:hypothetical protein
VTAPDQRRLAGTFRAMNALPLALGVQLPALFPVHADRKFWPGERLGRRNN